MSEPPRSEDIHQYWYSNQHQLPISIHDVGEPTCYACGWFNGFHALEDPDREPKMATSRLFRGLERAHVIPKSVGGSNCLSNFALLCRECHVEAPDTKDSEFFWRWVRNRRRSDPMDRYVARVKEAADIVFMEMNAAGLSVDDANSSGWDQCLTCRKKAIETLQPIPHWGAGPSVATNARAMFETMRLHMQGDCAPPQRKPAEQLALPLNMWGAA